MHELFLHVSTVFMGFLAIMNPLANTPVFLALTADDDEETRRSVARKGLWVAFVIVTVFALFGKLIFELFGISLPAFRITGGILVFGIGYTMLHGEPSKTHSPGEAGSLASKQSRLSVAVSPLAVPILAGPGTITTAMSFAAQGGPVPVATTLLTFGVVCGISYLLFVSGEKLVHYLGENAVSAVTRMMGLILAVIGVQMFLDGARGAVKAFS